MQTSSCCAVARSAAASTSRCAVRAVGSASRSPICSVSAARNAGVEAGRLRRQRRHDLRVARMRPGDLRVDGTAAVPSQHRAKRGHEVGRQEAVRRRVLRAQDGGAGLHARQRASPDPAEAGRARGEAARDVLALAGSRLGNIPRRGSFFVYLGGSASQLVTCRRSGSSSSDSARTRSRRQCRTGSKQRSPA